MANSAIPVIPGPPVELPFVSVATTDELADAVVANGSNKHRVDGYSLDCIGRTELGCVIMGEFLNMRLNTGIELTWEQP